MDERSPQLDRSILLRTALSVGKQLVVVEARLEPGQRSDAHCHPGHDFIFVLSGRGVMHVGDAEPWQIVAGDVAHVSPGEVHWTENPDSSQDLDVVAMWVIELDQPAVIPSASPK